MDIIYFCILSKLEQIYARKLYLLSFLALSGSGRYIMCGADDNDIHVWDTLKTSHLGVLKSHENRVTSICMAPNGMALASCSWDQFVKVWV